MKQIKYLLLIMLLLVFTSCVPTSSRLISITVLDVPEKVEIGKFDDAGIKLELQYLDGKFKHKELTKDMIPEDQQKYLYEEGTHNFNFLYLGEKVEFTLTMYKIKYKLVFVNILDQIVKEIYYIPNEEIIYPTEEEMYVEGYTFLGTYDKDLTIITNDLIIKGNYKKTHEHIYIEEVIKPTCIEQGYTKYTCECGDSYVDSYLDATGHNYINDQCSICKEFKVDVLLEFQLNDDGTYSVINMLKESTSIVIPELYNSRKVTTIGSYAFSGCTSLESITIPDSVTSIGEWAFEGCTSLTSITIPDSVTSIGSCAFSYCISLKSITIPESVTSIGDSVFRYCTSLKSITIPYGVTSIGEWAFYNCTSLESITIPESVKSIEYFTFYGCTSLESITILYGVTSIGGYAFSGCTSLKSITIPESVKSIGECTFYDCTSLESITIPESVTSIGGYAFSGCTSLTSITIPESVTSIGGYAFSGCYSLKSITIPESVTSIGGYAFYHCRSLTIYCKVGSKPSGWHTYWNYSERPVIWGFKG